MVKEQNKCLFWYFHPLLWQGTIFLYKLCMQEKSMEKSLAHSVTVAHNVKIPPRIHEM